jgi:hypothetical protein
MKQKLLLLVAFLCTMIVQQKVTAQTTLAAGDIAFTGYNAAGNNVSGTYNQFSFVILRTGGISANTVINFTDNGWNPLTSALTTNEGTITWTATADLPQFTQVVMKVVAGGTSIESISTGSVSIGGFFILSGAGDQVLAYQGLSTTPTFISGIHMNSELANGNSAASSYAAWDDIQTGGWAMTGSRSGVPTGLTSTGATPNAIMPVHLPGVAGAEYDNAVYNCTGQTGALSDIRTSINTVANWTGSNVSAAPLAIPSCTYSTSTCVAPAITNHPPNRIICAGGNTTFTSAATGDGLSYQWQANTGSGFANISNSAPYSGVTTSTLTITGATAGMTGYQYRVVVTGTCGTATSNHGTFTVSSVNTTGAQANVSCNGGSNGAAAVSASGGVTPYSYSWSPSGGTGATATGLSAGAYTVTVTDDIGCQATRNYTITQPPALVATPVSQTNVACNGGSTGAAQVTASGGTPGYTYSWSPSGGTSASTTGRTAGTYTVTVTDANGCEATRNFTITQPSALTVTPSSQTNIACFGGNTGAATINVPTGGAGGYTYNWTPGNPSGDGTRTITGLTAGTWTVTVTDVNACEKTQSFTLTQPSSAVSGSTVVTDVSCTGGSNGTINLTPTGGVGLYTFNWGGGVTTEDRTNLTAGSYSVTITDANSCTGTVNATVTEPSSLPTITLGTSPSVSAGTTTASLSYSATTGTPTTYTITYDAAAITAGFVDVTSTALPVSPISLTVPAAAAAGTYNGTLKVNNGTCESAGIAFTVTLTPAGPVFTTQPLQQTVCSGSSVTYTAAASGAISYWWQASTDGNSWFDINPGYSNATGVQTNTLTIINASSLSNYYFRLSATGAGSTKSYSNGVQNIIAAISGSRVVTNVACNGGSTGAINLTPTGGTGPYTFNWGGGVTTEDRTGLAAGTYSVTITDANGCTGTVSNISVTQPSSPVSGTTVVTNVACFGGSNGAINLTPTGGTGPYTFNWASGPTTEDRTGLVAGSYSVTITDANGCTGTVSNISVTQPSSPVSGTTVVTNVACFGGSNGAINLTPTGGTGPGTYTFNWVSGPTTEDRTGLVAGSYSVTITDANGCTGTVSNISVTQPSSPVSGTTVVTNVACNGGSNGAINLTPTGGTGPGTYTFNWASGPTTEDRTGLVAGSYSVTITDANGCTGTVSNISVTQPSSPVSGTTVVTNVACNGGSNGAINLTPTGGVGPYTFNWASGPTTEDRTGLVAGSYSVTITDANGCTGTVSNISVTQPSSPVSGTTVVTNVACNGGSNGAINLTPTGGTGPYTFNWAGGATTEDRTGLAAGTYSVTITDANGCTGTVSNISVTQPSSPVSGTTVVTNVACNGGSNGAINLTPTGGTGPYTFNWAGGVTTEDRTGLAAGTYSVTITDVNGCTSTVSGISVTQPSSAVSGTTVVTNVACNGGNTGAINLTPAGGVAPYTFNWGGVTTEDRTNLAAGSYSVTITDANGCTGTVNATVTQPTAISGTTVVTNVACNGGNTGAINLTPAGGVAPYTFNWGSATTEDRTGLVAGSYSVTITDANGCTGTVSNISVTQPTAPVSGTTVVTNVACNGGTTGAINLTPSGGTGPYTFNWGGVTTEDRTGLAAGSYSVTITDANGCTGTVSNISVTQPTSPVSGTTVVTNVACFGGNTGAINLTPAGGVGPYTFNWGSATTEDRTGLAAGTYSVTITDANGCTGTVSNISVTQPTAPVSGTTVVTNVACFGGSNGAINLTPAGGTGPYTFNWASGPTTEDRTGLAAGTYSVTITDNNGCTGTVSNISVTQPTAPVSGTTVVTNVACFGGSNGAINLTPAGGTGPYTFNWASGPTTEDRTGLAAGTYSVTITDNNGCTGTVSNISVTQPTAPVSGTTVVTNVACFGGNTGAINLTPTGGTGPYTFNWASGPTTEDRTGLAAGTYSVTITDANGCTGTVSNISVTQPTAPVSGTTVVTNVACNGGTNGAINLTPNGGVGPYTFNWASGPTTEDRTGLAAGTYSVTITDNNGCTGTVSNISVTQPTAISVTVAAQTNVACNGGSNGAASINVPTGGTGAYTYDWTPGNPTGDGTTSVTGLTAGTWTVTVTDANSCQKTQSFTITQPAAIAVYNVTGGGAYCSGGIGMNVGLSNSETGVNYQLYRGATSVGTAVAGTGSAISFGNQTTAGTYTVVATNTATLCTANMTGSATVVVNPTPDVNVVSSQVKCNGAPADAVTFSGSVGGTTFGWANNTTSIGLLASGTGDIASFTATNTGTAPVIATITVTPSTANCTGSAKTFTYTVNPTPTVNTITDQTRCNGATTAAVTFSGAVSGTTYTWTNTNTAIGLGASGTGNIAAFTATNTTNAPISGTVTVTPSANSCTGATKSYTYTVNPTPTVNTINNQTVCNGATTLAANFTGAVTGTTYSWTNTNTAIGLGASGTGNIAAFTATNTTNAPISGTVTVTPSANSCTGTTRSYIYTVNPTPTVNTIADQTRCNGATTAAVNFSSPVSGTTYSWANSNTAIGLGASGTGNIAAFTATNTTNAPITGTITVTPTANSCTGINRTYTYTVNPTPVVDAIADQTRCNGFTTNAVNFTGAVSGTSYAWTNTTPSIGLAASGTGNIASFTALNTTNAPMIATITVTPSANSCTGSSTSYTYTVNPTPTVNAISNQAVCNGATASGITLGSPVSGTSYAWVNNTPSIGLSASGTGDIPAFTATNTTTDPVTATVTITPTANTCIGIDRTFNITVNPTPWLTSALSLADICDLATVNYTPASATVGTTYAWVRPSIVDINLGSAASGSGAISEQLNNTSNAPVLVTYNYTLSANSCSNTQQVTVVVNPTPTVNAISSYEICHNAPAAAITVAGPVSGTTFDWTNTDPSIGLAVSGTGDIPAFTATNTTTDPVTATVTITPTANSCVGINRTFNITVNPTPWLTSTLVAPAICEGTQFGYTPTSATAGTTYTWSRAAIADINNGAGGSGTAGVSEVLNNNNANPVVVTYNYQLTANGCTNSQDVKVTVNPLPVLSSTLTDSVCSEGLYAYTPASATNGTAFSWTRAGVTGITPATGTGNGNISETLTNTTNGNIKVNYVYTLAANGCSNNQTLGVMVNSMPAPPVISIMPSNAVCDNTMYQNFGTTTPAVKGAYYTWTADNATVWASGDKGEHAIVNFTEPGTAVVTLNSNYPNSGCTNSSSYTVTVSENEAEEPKVAFYNGHFVCLLNKAETYRWGYDEKETLDSAMITGETNQNYYNPTPDLETKYYWVMTTKEGCSQKAYFNKPTTVGTVASRDEVVKLYPNPATEMVTIEVSANRSLEASVKLFDLTGKALKTIPVSGTKTQVGVGELTPGIYFIGYYQEGKRVATLKFIKQ